MCSNLRHPDPILDTALGLLESHSGEFWMLVTGESMLPLIREGDRLLAQPLQGIPVRGDILVCRQANGLVAHRLLRILQVSQGDVIFITHGDHALSPDPPISGAQITGRVITLQRGQKVLRLDTPGWRRVGGAVSVFQIAFNWADNNPRLRWFLSGSLELALRMYLRIYTH